VPVGRVNKDSRSFGVSISLQNALGKKPKKRGRGKTVQGISSLKLQIRFHWARRGEEAGPCVGFGSNWARFSGKRTGGGVFKKWNLPEGKRGEMITISRIPDASQIKSTSISKKFSKECFVYYFEQKKKKEAKGLGSLDPRQSTLEHYGMNIRRPEPSRTNPVK